MEGNNIPLETDMTFTVEPGVYDQELGGIRIEDNVVVTRDGSETLTSFGRELRVIGL
jgi:Xaa-Pro dipeptidase